MKCSGCFYYSICGSASMHNDASMCKQYVDKGSLVSIDVLHNVQDTCEDLRKKIRSLTAENKHLELCLEDANRELRDLKIIKQTLEMMSGTKFEFED